MLCPSTNNQVKPAENAKTLKFLYASSGICAVCHTKMARYKMLVHFIEFRMPIYQVNYSSSANELQLTNVMTGFPASANENRPPGVGKEPTASNASLRAFSAQFSSVS